MRVVVVGAGAWGLPTAAELVRRGHDVTLVDRYAPGNPWSSSSGPTRLWRVADPDPAAIRLGRRALAALRRLEDRLGQSVHTDSGLLWRDRPAALEQITAAVAGGGRDPHPGPGRLGRRVLPRPGARRPRRAVVPRGRRPARRGGDRRLRPAVRRRAAGARSSGRRPRRCARRTRVPSVTLADGRALDAEVAVVCAGPGTPDAAARTSASTSRCAPSSSRSCTWASRSDPHHGDELPCLFDGPGEDDAGIYAMPTPGVGYKIGIDSPLRELRPSDLDRTPDPDADPGHRRARRPDPADLRPRGRRRARLLLDRLARRLVRDRPGGVGRRGLRRLRQGLQVLAGHRRDPGRPGRGRRAGPRRRRHVGPAFRGTLPRLDLGADQLGCRPSLTARKSRTTMTQPTYQVTEPRERRDRRDVRVRQRRRGRAGTGRRRERLRGVARAPGRGACGDRQEGRRALRRASGRARRLAATEMGKSVAEGGGEVEFSADIFNYYADNGPGLLEPRDGARERDRPGRVPRRRHDPRRHAVELPLLPGGPLRGAQPDRRQHDGPQARRELPDLGAGDRRDHARRGRARRRLRQRVRHPRAGRGDDRGPARPRCLAHRLRAGRCGRRRGGRPEPEEGRARARRLGSLHRARHDGRGRAPPRPPGRSASRTSARRATPTSG